ncbi:ferrochelatase [Ancrocorticia populi]|uniref:Coproporphyrin III ferrochelatase n=1 Tax=Ancrocorticia populi TaxID=2175228 RepID=A0A2V1K7Y8_9ACTO|nr:ferrochelatase [Ancrocorticia populi]PWF27233.1 ferrochelatase [Ancrocorticia populi]
MKPAVLIVNLGTPEAPTAKKVRPYLREFLSDRRVVEMHPAVWRPILDGIILRVRPKASAEKYASIWYPEGSPLMHWTVRQRDALIERLGDSAEVRLAMRYGKPSVQSELSRLHADGYRKVLVVPLYPQYAASSAGTVVDEVARWILGARDQLEIRTVRSFPEAPAYIDALVGAIESSWQENGRPDFAGGDKLITSFHGIPKAMHEGGDPYRYECEATADLLRKRLGLDEGQLVVTFQSVFGPSEWLKPATIDMVEELGKGGTRRVDVICPGFMADCLETLEEINILNRETFMDAGGQEFHYIPWANDSEGCINAIEEQVAGRIAGW